MDFVMSVACSGIYHAFDFLERRSMLLDIQIDQNTETHITLITTSNPLSSVPSYL